MVLGAHSSMKPLPRSSCSCVFFFSFCAGTSTKLNWRTDLTKEVIYANLYYSCWCREGEDQAQVGGMVPLGSVVDLC